MTRQPCATFWFIASALTSWTAFALYDLIQGMLQ